MEYVPSARLYRQRDIHMTIDDLGAWGDFLGGFAVLAGLVFVGMQLVISNREARLAANRNYAESIVNVTMALVGDAEFADIYLRGNQGLKHLEGSERVRFIAFISSGMLRTWEPLYLEHCAGRLDSSVWNGAEATLSAGLSTKGFQDVWSLRKHWFEKDFQVYVDLLIEKDENRGELERAYKGEGV